MTTPWDEFSKSLAYPVPRRESLRLFGAALASAVLSPLGLGSAFAEQRDPCKTFCKCRNKSQQSQCLAECRACNSDPRFLCGSCSGGYACADLANDPWNCGACFNVCGGAGPYEYPVCNNGRCEYHCESGAVRCNGTCTHLDWDQDNCGACGNVCPDSVPICSLGVCTACPSGQSLCEGQCVDIMFDANNCGECGQVCPVGEVCSSGVCCNPTISDCFGSSDPCVFPFILCGGVCVDPTSDPFNCGGCGMRCANDEVCIFGFCESGGG